MEYIVFKQLLKDIFMMIIIVDITVVCGRDRWAGQSQQGEKLQDHSKHKVYRTPDKLPTRTNRQGGSDRPNIVFVLTDDQDYDLGSMNFMPKTMRYLRDEGAHFPNAYVTTPMCCPSRSSILTGMYAHNHYIFTNNENCSNVEWQQTFEINNFGRYLSDAGYRTGYFGKYLNDYQGTYIPPGWTEWVGLVRNTRYYNYSLNFNGEKIKHGDDYHKDYLTDLIANDSVTFLKQSKQYFPNRPVAMVLSMPAPHGPEDSAPQYQHLFNNVTSYRTPSWNYAPNPDKQWLLQNTGKMEPIHMAFTDMLQQKRLQTLQSVDDAVEKVYKELSRLGELENTYFVYSSDHGYHLGQYGLLKGKAMPYEFDIRVPFYIRGPKIPAGTRVPNIALNVDLAPTFLDIAGIEAPEHMDGRSLLKLFDDPEVEHNGILKRKKAWRDTFLVERGKVTQKKIKERERLEADKNSAHINNKVSRLQQECQKAEYQPPCSPNQQWECRTRPDGMLRMYKCRQKYTYKKTDNVIDSPPMCVCPELKSSSAVIEPSRKEKKHQKQFLIQHVNQPEMLKKPKFIRTKYKRSAAEEYVERLKGKNIDGPPVVCKLLNNSVVCEPDVYTDQSKWNQQRNALDSNIEELKQQLDYLRGIKKHLKKKKPVVPGVFEDDDEFEGSAEGVNMQNSHQDKYNFHDITPFTPKPHKRKPSYVGIRNQSTIGNYPTNDTYKRDNMGASKQPISTPFSQYDKSMGKKHDSDEDMFERLADSETDYDDGRVIDEDDEMEGRIVEDYQFNPEDFQDETDRDKNLLSDLPRECICDVMLSDQRMTSDEIKKLQRFEKKRDRKILNRQKKREKLEEREKKRYEKQTMREKNKKSHKNKSKTSEVDPTRDCSSKNMKCFEHTNDHWKTSPFWTKIKPSPVASARKDPMCAKGGMDCTRMDNSHWDVQPKWTLGPFCFCPNSNNNTYWCLRTINETHNYMYCEFITGFISYYDFIDDPYQLKNAVRDLNYATLNELHMQLEKLKSCKGASQCTERTRPDNSSIQKPRKEKKKFAVIKDKPNYEHDDSNSNKLRTQSRRPRFRYRRYGRKW